MNSVEVQVILGSDEHHCCVNSLNSTQEFSGLQNERGVRETEILCEKWKQQGFSHGETKSRFEAQVFNRTLRGLFKELLKHVEEIASIN